MISTRIDRIAGLLGRIRQYGDIVTADSFENATLAEMKANVKAILKDAEAEISGIEDEVDNW